MSATNLFAALRHSSFMRLARQWTRACPGAGPGLARRAAPAGEFTLTADEARRVAARQVVIRANLDASQRRGTVRAAVRIEAPPDHRVPDDDPLRGRPAVRAPPAEVPGARAGARRQLAAGRTRDRFRLVRAAGQLGVPRRSGRRPQHRLSPGRAATSRRTRAPGSSSPPRMAPPRCCCTTPTSIHRALFLTGWRARASGATCRRC